MPDEPIPFYPDLRCHAAPLRPCPPAPTAGCSCRVCSWARLGSTTEPIRPGTPEWLALLEVSRRDD